MMFVFLFERVKKMKRNRELFGHLNSISMETGFLPI